MTDRARAAVEHLLDQLVNGTLEKDPASVVELFTPDVTYLVGPEIPLVHGRAGLLAEFARQAPTFRDLEITVKAIVSDGAQVVTERVDTMTFSHNGVRASNPLLALFEVDENGLIGSWREYWDMQSLGKSLSAPAAG
ncbi:MAG: putative terpene synthesis protein [Pseudonocardiales bacterium]|nr:putative terpene synthesis protein [Pseudonocardiales bacterium]